MRSQFCVCMPCITCQFVFYLVEFKINHTEINMKFMSLQKYPRIGRAKEL